MHCGLRKLEELVNNINDIIENRIEEPEALKDFTMGGYAYDSSMSDDTTWTFIR